jgi:hypothetical protein
VPVSIAERSARLGAAALALLGLLVAWWLPFPAGAVGAVDGTTVPPRATGGAADTTIVSSY